MTTVDLIVRLLGRDLTWRFSRALYMAARGEGYNDLARNSEGLVIERVAKACAAAGKSAVVFDCGANLGIWTDLARETFAQNGVQARFHMFEPSPASHASIAAKTHELANVTLHQMALSDQEGEAAFHLVSPTGGTNSLSSADIDAQEVIRVRTARGSDIAAAAGLERIDLLKIDTEGHDYAVLCGFEDMLARQAIGVIQFEYNHRWLASGRSLHHVFTLAAAHGYVVGRADHGGIDIYGGWNPEIDRFIEWNYLLIAPDQISAIGARRTRWTESNTLTAA